MQSSFKLFGILLIASATLQSCDFSKTKNEEPIPQPTPLSLDVPFYFGDFVIPSNNPTTVEGVALGRMLFYDP